MQFSKSELEQACDFVHQHMKATPEHVWPQISEKLGATVWVKHENHTPTGAFKVRGGITFIDWLKKEHPDTNGVITATRGNHGQSQARAATARGLSAKIIVPFNNSAEKNAAMRSFGGNLIEHGKDFDEARLKIQEIAEKENRFIVPAFHREIVRGVATYGFELFTSAPDLDTVYVPIGCGSGICGTIAARDTLGLKTAIVGVVSTEAAGAKLSFDAKQITETPSANTFADGMAVRTPVKEAFDVYRQGADRIVSVSDDEIADAMRLYYTATHNVAEGAGAAALAALMQERSKMAGKNVGVILSGGNIDADMFAEVLQGKTPTL